MGGNTVLHRGDLKKSCRIATKKKGKKERSV